MATKTITIENILGGVAETQTSGSKGTFNIGLGIDPDFALSDPDNSGAITTGVRTSGMIMPTRYEKFSSTGISDYPKWLLTNPKDTKVYAYMDDGEIFSYTSSLASETSVGTPTATGEGAAYYNNYLYFARTNDIDRYGPLNGSPSYASGVWSGVTLGSQGTLSAADNFPTLNGAMMPGHIMHVHGDNALYFGTYDPTAYPGQSTLNRIKTSKTTDEGDTNNGSTKNVLPLPFGFLITDIESYGVDIVVAAIQGTNTTIHQGRAALFFWDTTSTNFYRGPIYVSDPLITAMKNVNGELYVWSGNAVRGCRLSKYIGGDSLQEITFVEDSTPPLAGAVESLGNRIAWGGVNSYPSTAGVVYTYGSKDKRLQSVLMTPILSTAGATTPIVTSILNYAHASYVRPKLIVGWGNGTTYGIDKLSTTATYASVWRSELYSIPGKFRITKVRIPLSAAVAANMSIVPKLFFDDFSASATLATINNTNYSGKKRVVYHAAELDDISAGGNIGYNNVLLELTFGGTAEVAVNFPIVIEYEEMEDEE